MANSTGTDAHNAGRRGAAVRLLHVLVAQGPSGTVLKACTHEEFWGDGLGTAIHVMGYSVAPLVFGLTMICLGVLDGPAEEDPPQTDDLHLSAEQRAALRFGMAQGELMTAGFALVGGSKPDRIDVEDGDFKAAIVSSGPGWRVERSGHAPVDQVSIDEAVAKIFEAHRPRR